MPALIPTKYSATVTWLGYVPDREASLKSTALAEVMLTYAGMAGEAHGGVTRPSCSRVASQHPRNTEIRNVRQLAVLSAEDLAEVAAVMGLETLDPAWLGTSIVVSGIPNFSRVPPSSRLQAPSGATIVIDMENWPCTLPAKVIEGEAKGYGKLFKPSAEGKRGVTAWVEREGLIRIGDRLTLHIPNQPVWAHLAENIER